MIRKLKAGGYRLYSRKKKSEDWEAPEYQGRSRQRLPPKSTKRPSNISNGIDSVAARWHPGSSCRLN